MKNISVLIKPASGGCNIKCRYCFYADVSSERTTENYGKMSTETAHKLIDNIYADLNDGDRITFGFQGGEPTLIGVDFYYDFIKYIKAEHSSKIEVSYSIQTNGVLIDDRWCRLFKENGFLVGLSLDGDKGLNNTYRLDHSGNGTFERIMNAKKLLEEYEIEYNILCVLTNQTAREPQRIFDFILKEKIKYIQFIPCLDEFNAKVPSVYALSPRNFAYFYNRLFPLWKEQWDNGNYISIGLFDNVITYISTGRVGSCGLNGKCGAQYVIEANGDIFPCDFYVLDEFYSGNITANTLKDAFYHKATQKFLAPRKILPDYCMKCSFLKICGGGCKRMKHAMYLDFNEEYCGYRDFLLSQQEGIVQVIQSLA